MTIKEFLKYTDPDKAGVAWIYVYRGSVLECKFNTASSFIKPILDAKIKFIQALELNIFAIDLGEELPND